MYVASLPCIVLFLTWYFLDLVNPARRTLPFRSGTFDAARTLGMHCWINLSCFQCLKHGFCLAQVIDKGCFDALKPEDSSKMLMEAADWHVENGKSSACTFELSALARRKSSELDLNHSDNIQNIYSSVIVQRRTDEQMKACWWRQSLLNQRDQLIAFLMLAGMSLACCKRSIPLCHAHRWHFSQSGTGTHIIHWNTKHDWLRYPTTKHWSEAEQGKCQVPLCRPSESPCLLKMSWEIVKCAGWYQALGTPARIPDVDDEARKRRNSANSSQNQIGYI